jgi:hypothetical protein
MIRNRQRTIRQVSASIVPWNAICCTLAAEVTAIAAFYALEWRWLRQALVGALGVILPAIGCSVHTALYSLTVGNRLFQFDSDCTYVDLVLCSLPFLWRTHRRLAANLVVMSAFASIVLMGNLVRVALGICAVSHGVSTFWAHDVPDYMLWYPTLIVVCVLWLRNLLRKGDGRGCVLPGLCKVPQTEQFEATLLEQKSVKA